MTAQQKQWIQTGKKVLDIEIQGLEKVRQDLDLSFAQALEILAACTGRIVITGVGKSGLVGRKIAATLSSTGTPSFFLHPVEGAHGDLGMLRAEDIVLAISNSGETDELNAILPTVRRLGIKIIAFTADLQSTLARISDIGIKIKVDKEACPLGMAPTASTTASLAVGDALAVALITIKDFSKQDFQKNHPGGTLGQRLAMQVKDLMHNTELPTASLDSPFKEALDILNQSGLGTVLIVDNEHKLQGILTDGDVRRILCSHIPDLDRPAHEYMTTKPTKVVPESSAALAMDIMEEKAITVIPVVDDSNKLCGIVHMHDLLGKGRLKFSDEHGKI